MPQRPDLSLIIVSWNVKDNLRTCLASLFHHLPSGRFEVWVVDNASADGSVDMVKQAFPQVHLIANSTNRGFAAANNQAIDSAQGEVVLLLNPDTELPDDSIMNLLPWMHAHPNLGVAGCHLLHGNGSTQASVRRFPNFRSQAMILLKLHLLFGRLNSVQSYLAADFDYEKEQPVDQVKGAAFFIHRRAIDCIGKLDEGFWIWFEEVDYCRRIWDSGLEVWYTPMASVLHHQGKSFRKVSTLLNQRRMNRSMRYYFKKHHSIVATLGIMALQPLSLLLALMATFVPRRLKEAHGIRS